MYSLVKSLYWNKRKDPLKGVPLNRCPWEVSKIREKYLRESSCLCLVFKILLKLKVISLYIFEIQEQLSSKNNNVF